MDSLKEGYLSSEELDALIRQVETQEMLQAPSYLKEEILLCVKEETGQNGPGDRKKRELFAYSLRVGLAAAAAIAMLFLMPVEEYRRNGYVDRTVYTEYRSPSGRAARTLKEHSNELCRKLNAASNWLVPGERGRSGT